MSNLKQLGEALHSYINENDDFVPPSMQQGNTAVIGALNPILNGRPGGYVNCNGSRAGVWWCPEDRVRDRLNTAMMSYAVNYYITGSTLSGAEPSGGAPNSGWAKRYGQLLTPANVLYMMDSTRSSGYPSSIAATTWPFNSAAVPNLSDTVCFPHDNRSNALFCDGHVVSLTVSDCLGNWRTMVLRAYDE